MNLVVTRAANPPTLTYQVRLAQRVNLQANQNYLISVDARAATERPLSIGIENAAGGFGFTPEIAREAYERGWGEPHPYSGTPLIFGPRDHEELDVVWRLLQASYAFAKG